MCHHSVWCSPYRAIFFSLKIIARKLRKCLREHFWLVVRCLSGRHWASCPAEKTGRDSRLNRPSCSPDDPIGHLTELKRTERGNNGQFWRSKCPNKIAVPTVIIVAKQRTTKWNYDVFQLFSLVERKTVKGMEMTNQIGRQNRHIYNWHVLKVIVLIRTLSKGWNLIFQPFRWKGRQEYNLLTELNKNSWTPTNFNISMKEGTAGTQNFEESENSF